MTTSDKHIKVSKFLDVTVLSNRSTARTLVDEIKENNESKVNLDFENVEFASRSFMDELNSQISNTKEINFFKTSMNEQIRKMDNLVQNKDTDSFQSEPEKHTNTNVIAM